MRHAPTRRPVRATMRARLATCVLLTFGMCLPALPAAAAAAAAHLSSHADTGTVLVHSPITVIGRLTPAKAGESVTLQRLSGRSWIALAHAHSAADGSYTVTVKAPGKAASWQLRAEHVVGHAKALLSPAFAVHVVTHAFTVVSTATSPVASGGAVVAVGVVVPSAKGRVTLEVDKADGWQPLTTAVLTKTSTFRLSSILPPGSYRLRVLTGYTTKLAAGTGSVLPVTVTPAVTPPTATPTPPPVDLPVVTNTFLPTAVAFLPYTATLLASHGVAPYTWTATGLPAGLVLSAAGVLAGVPLAPLTATLTVTVTDAAGHKSSLPLFLTVAASPAAGNVVRSWGDNGRGALGDGGTTDSDLSVAVTGLTGITAVAGGAVNGYALRDDGTVWGWGDDVEGQVGDGQSSSSLVTAPVQVQGLPPSVAIAAGNASGASHFAVALTAAGTVWSWGDTAGGVLGNGTSSGSAVPVQVSNLTGVTAIAAGAQFGYAVKADGTVWYWGDASSKVPQQVLGLPGPAVGVAGGLNASFALLADGTVWAWGTSSTGLLGTGTNTPSATPVQVTGLPHVASIAAGYGSAYALGSDGSVWAWGDNLYGQLGDGSTTASNVPVTVSGLTGIVAIAAGSFGLSNQVAIALRPDGTVRVWGASALGELGNGTTSGGSSPTEPTLVNNVKAVGAGGGSIYAVVAGS